MVSFADPVTPRLKPRRPKLAAGDTCAVCGRELAPLPEPVYSRVTGRRFCSPAIGHLKGRKA